MTPPLGLSLDVSAVPPRPGGAGYYTMALASGLVARDNVALTLISRRDDGARWTVLAPAARVRPAVPTARPARLAFEQVGLPSLLGSSDIDVHHGPHYTMPSRAPVPCAVTIHDCTFFDHPEWHVRSKAIFFRRAIRRAALRAGALICVSQVTAERLHASCAVRAPVVVAHHGVDHERFGPTEPFPGADGQALEAAGVPVDRPLIVFVGTLEPRKGVVPLIGAFDRLAERERDVVLVLAGQPGWGLEETEHALAAARHGDRIVRTGYVPDATVPALLRRAAVAVCPALEEGFGLPALEALACGAPLRDDRGHRHGRGGRRGGHLGASGKRGRPGRGPRGCPQPGLSRRASASRDRGGTRLHLGGQRRPSPRGLCHGRGGPEVGFRGCGL
jgi:glycosyltransferase involved in cell wall biosynthesis